MRGQYLIFLFSLLAINTAAFAGSGTQAPALNGWVHSEDLSGDSSEHHGILLEGKPATYSSVAVGEVDGDSSDGLETVSGGSDGTVYAYHSDGTLLWKAYTPNHTCTGNSSNNKLLSSPAIGNLFGNGVPYVVVGYGGIGGRACDGGVMAIKGTDGSMAWKFSLRAFSKSQHYGTFSYSVFSSPSLADTDGDGKLEVGFGSFDRNVYLLNANGSVRWYYNAADTVWSSPAFVNVDSDSKLEMIIGTDISANSHLKPITKNGGYVYAFKTAARKKKHLSFRQKDAFVWQTYFDQVVYASPTIADVLPDVPGEEIIIGSGCFFPQRKSNKNGKWVKILRKSDGKVMKTLKAPGCLTSTVAVGDIDDDGVAEIVASVNGHRSIGGDGYGRVVAWKPSVSSDPIWSTIPRVRGSNDPYVGNFNSPILADVDGNGSIEVLISNLSAITILNGRDGTPLTCQSSDCSSSTYVLKTAGVLRCTPAVADVNGDGKLDVIVAGQLGGEAALFGWTDLAGLLGSSSGTQSAYRTPWPMYRGNAAHTGN